MSDEKRINKLALDFMGEPPARLSRTAGEVTFIKQKVFENREFLDSHKFKAAAYIQISKILWQLSVALGHTSSIVSSFSRIKSFTISPDGHLGGSGYAKSIPDFRSELAETLNLMSNLQDTLHDEVNAPHWKPVKKTLTTKQKAQIEEIEGDVEEILKNPELYAEKEFKEEVLDAI